MARADVGLALDFTSASSWQTFDPSSNGVGTSAVGFSGATFDGRYVYFAPFWQGRSEVLRYDTQLAFGDALSWQTYDPGSQGGYAGNCFDGRYVYFSPWSDLVVAHSEVLRFDTTLAFDSAAAWTTFDPSANGVGNDAVGFWGIECHTDGFVYFSPEFAGEVMRYDGSKSFTSAASWETFSPGDMGVGSSPTGYKGIVFAQGWLYFVPYYDSVGSHGEVLAYDTSLPFASVMSWDAYTPHDHGVGAIGRGFEEAIFDGRYVYFVPSYAGFGQDAYHGEVLRYDTTLAFASAASWSAYDPGNTGGVGSDPDGYNGAHFDGQFIYFVPTNHGSPDGPHGEALRYDTMQAFNSAAAWTAYDPGANGVGTDPDGYAGSAFDGRYLYFAPDRNETNVPHGEVLRLDLFNPPVPGLSSFGIIGSVISLVLAGGLVRRRDR